eukprot:2632584-Lingulodinium_polyedra.AAC.1
MLVVESLRESILDVWVVVTAGHVEVLDSGATPISHVGSAKFDGVVGSVIESVVGVVKGWQTC